MNNTNSFTHDNQLNTWVKIISDCKEVKASGVKIKDWLKSNNIFRDTYYYWYSMLKTTYSSNALPEVVAIDSTLLSIPDTSKASVSPLSDSLEDSYTSSKRPCIRLTINDISIEVSELDNPTLLTNVIKAVCYA